MPVVAYKICSTLIVQYRHTGSAESSQSKPLDGSWDPSG